MHFQLGEGPSRGLLRDCTTSQINRFQLYTKLRALENRSQFVVFRVKSACCCEAQVSLIPHNTFEPW